MSYELQDLPTMTSTLDEARVRWEKSLRLHVLFTIFAIVIVWLVAKKGVDATDMQLLCAIIAVATITLLLGICWVGYIVAIILGGLRINVEKLAHVITEKSAENAGEAPW